jgi:hypothetical protein
MKTSVRLIFFTVVIFVVGGIIFTISGYQNKQSIKTKVIDKERITQRNGDVLESFYLIYTEAGTFKLEDELFYGNFNSSDWYGQIRKDSTYTFQTIGYRIGFLSSYPNIVNFN